MTDRDAIALTLFGEARGEGINGIIAVACVIRNRFHATRNSTGAPTTYASVCLKPEQFSCWNGGSNFAFLASLGSLTTDPILLACYTVADVLLYEGGISHLISQDVRHYYANSGVNAIAPPSWAEHGTVVASIGHHLFLSGVDGPPKVTV